MKNELKKINKKSYRLIITAMFLSGCTGVDGVGGGSVGLFTPVEPTSNFGFTNSSSTLASGLLGDIFNPIRAVLMSIAVISIFMCGIALIVAPNQRSVEMAKSWLKYVLIGMLMLAAVNPFINWLRTL